MSEALVRFSCSSTPALLIVICGTSKLTPSLGPTASYALTSAASGGPTSQLNSSWMTHGN